MKFNTRSTDNYHDEQNPDLKKKTKQNNNKMKTKKLCGSPVITSYLTKSIVIWREKKNAKMISDI